MNGGDRQYAVLESDRDDSATVGMEAINQVKRGGRDGAFVTQAPAIQESPAKVRHRHWLVAALEPTGKPASEEPGAAAQLIGMRRQYCVRARVTVTAPIVPRVIEQFGQPPTDNPIMQQRIMNPTPAKTRFEFLPTEPIANHQPRADGVGLVNVVFVVHY
jgi:hypothetical protein